MTPEINSLALTPDEVVDAAEIDSLRAEVARLKGKLEEAAKDFDEAAKCVESGAEGAITDTVWLRPGPALCPTLFEHLFAAAIRARGAR